MDHDNGSGTKVITGIGQIVRLKGIIQKWQNVSGSPGSSPRSAGISPAVSMRLKSSNVHSDSDDESCPSPEPPPDVPRGYLAVYVGPELRRFIIPTGYLMDPLFKVLLEKAEEEFGFDRSGGLTIPCEIETFEYVVQCIENNGKEQCDDDDDPIPSNVEG